ncbi:Flp pilus assembly protein TadD, containings TPR repeats [Nostoc flagelliforme CCNUN1]|uniref:Flp pilus assembly protein TadD, containings TPR repeats n=1 Tax=Nostoc flagelliforme CCNUN1 TaxID=2038116 RepID=A0A2K8SQZ7_9NOSO|nr:SMI1/KNR4 family protein [Nostoc flagelliforme]AUB37733.1 Flp pilus assembly protein TadD, containings TPR repeats [Nostoc flagelliforme CCNUN1]
MDKVLQLKKNLTQLAILDATFEVFGSESHQYQFKPCLSNKDIQVFESRYNITLPSEYRNFLLEIGNGGAGPGYGLSGLSGIESEDVIPEKLYPENYEILSKPFPFTKAWNDLDLIAKNNTDFVTKNDDYFDDKFIQGTLSITNYGCGIYAMLVVTGEQSGKIWIDDRTNDNGIYPACLSFCHAFHDINPDDSYPNSNEEQPLSFYEWYEDWLNRSLEQIRQSSET